jgi:hypothetical protein
VTDRSVRRMWVGRSQWGEGDAYLNADLAGLLVVDHLLAPAAADAVVASMIHGKKEVCVTLCRVAICSHLSENLPVALSKPHVPLCVPLCVMFVCVAWRACVRGCGCLLHLYTPTKIRRVVHRKVHLISRMLWMGRIHA